MNSLRKWFYKPKREDTSRLAQFYWADEELNSVATELDSFDGRKDPERCTALVNQLRACQDKVLSICQEIMDEAIPSSRANRDFRAKFPDEVLQDNLPGQLWFGAECLAAGSNILNREAESASMRPLAKAVTKSLDSVRCLLREQCIKNPFEYCDKVTEALNVFDRLFAEFELCYVSAMVPVKSSKEHHIQQEVTVLFSETLQRALHLSLVGQEMIDDCDPSLMFTIPRLAIVCGLTVFPEGPLNVDQDPLEMSELFRPFYSLLYKIRDLLWTLTREEMFLLEKALTVQENPNTFVYSDIHYTHSETQDYISLFYQNNQNCTQFIQDFFSHNFGSQPYEQQDVEDEEVLEKLVQSAAQEHLRREDTLSLTNSGSSTSVSPNLFSVGQYLSRESPTEQITHNVDKYEELIAGIHHDLPEDPQNGSSSSVDVLGVSADDDVQQCSSPLHNKIYFSESGILFDDSHSPDSTLKRDAAFHDLEEHSSIEITSCDQQSLSSSSDNTEVNNLVYPDHQSNAPRRNNCTTDDVLTNQCLLGIASPRTLCQAAEEILRGSCTPTSKASTPYHDVRLTPNSGNSPSHSGQQGVALKPQQSSSVVVKPKQIQRLKEEANGLYPCTSYRSVSSASSSGWESSSYHSPDTSSYNSQCQDDEEIALALQAAEIASRNDIRSRFKSSEDLIHRLFVCVSGVADQLQTNYASEMRNILKAVFDMNCSVLPEETEVDGSCGNESAEITPTSENEGIISEVCIDGPVNSESYNGESHSWNEEENNVECAEEALPEFGNIIPDDENRESPDLSEEPPAWMPDEQTSNCMACQAPFTLLRRRHHCRNCGKIFCSRCSSNSIPLPHYGHVKPVRVCNHCFMYEVTPFVVQQRS